MTFIVACTAALVAGVIAAALACFALAHLPDIAAAVMKQRAAR